MTRLFSLILTFSVLFFSLATPASAADTVSVGSLVDLLDYGYSLETSSNTQNFNGNSTLDMTYMVSSKITTTYVDVLFMYRTSGELNVDLMLDDTVKASLEPYQVSGNIWRAYGSYTGYWADTFTLRFDALAANTNRITILSFEVGRTGNTRVPIEGYMDIIGSNYTNTIHYVPTDATNQRDWTPTTPGTAQFFLYTEDWRKYDYIDFMFNLYVDDITSINCVFGSEVLPFDVSYIDSGTLGYMETSISVRVDVSQVDRTADDDYYPMIIITATESTGNLASVSFIEGVIEYDIESPFVYWMHTLWYTIGETAGNIISAISQGFDNLAFDISALGDRIKSYFADLQFALTSKLDAIHDAIVGDSTSADEFNDKLDDTLGELEDVQSELENATQPDIETEIGDIDTTVTAEASGFMGDVFEIFISSNVFGTILIFSVTLALVSYVLYGKR